MNSFFLSFNKLKPVFLSSLSIILLASCASPPPSDINNVCHIFKQYPKWYGAAKDVERRWKVPVPVQMAILHQESKFNARARPRRTKFMSVIPWKRPSSAYGYTQALNDTWNQYKRTNGGLLTSRDNFSAGVDFIGWYANLAYRRAGISRSDAYSLYLAYHEGVGGYQRRTYTRKTWLLQIAHKVKSRSQIYAMQLNSCKKSLKSRFWF